MPHVVEGSVDAGIAGAKDFLLGQISAGIAGGVPMSEVAKLHALLAVVEHELVVKDHVRRLERALGDVFTALGPLAGVLELLGAIDAQEPSAVRLGDDAGAFLGEHGIAIGVVAM